MADFRRATKFFYAKVVDGELFRLRGDVFGAPSFDRKATPRKGVSTLMPVVPIKIICRRLQLRRPRARDGQRELPKEPLIWFKATTSLLPDGGKIEIPFPQHRTDFEAELAHRHRTKNPQRLAHAGVALHFRLHRVAGHQRPHDPERPRASGRACKSFDTFTPLGPLVETQIDPHELEHPAFPKRPAAPELEHQASSSSSRTNWSASSRRT